MINDAALAPTPRRRSHHAWRTAAQLAIAAAALGCAREGGSAASTTTAAAAPAAAASSKSAAAGSAAAAAEGVAAPAAAAEVPAANASAAAASADAAADDEAARARVDEARRRAVEAHLAKAGTPEGEKKVPGMAPDDVTRDLVLAARAPTMRNTQSVEQLIRAIRHVAANRNLAGLERYMTPKLVASTRAMMPEHAERFWAHLARYVSAGEQGFGLERKPGGDESSLELVVKVAPDIVLRPIVVRSEAGWAFDRF